MKENLKGKQFYNWIVLEKDLSKRKDKHIYWICQCKCGKIKSIRGTSLKNGSSKSCGCIEKILKRVVLKIFQINNLDIGLLFIL